jgi:hypothetical protein
LTRRTASFGNFPKNDSAKVLCYFRPNSGLKSVEGNRGKRSTPSKNN